MKTLNMLKVSGSLKVVPYAGLVLGLILLVWPLLQRIVQFGDPAMGYVDPNIWLLALFGVAVFLMILGVVWWLLQRYWLAMGLPNMEWLVLQFEKLELWQQLKFYYAFFALLLLAGVGCLIAVL